MLASFYVDTYYFLFIVSETRQYKTSGKNLSRSKNKNIKNLLKDANISYFLALPTKLATEI